MNAAFGAASKMDLMGAFSAFLDGYWGAIAPNPIDDLPPQVQNDNLPESARVPSEKELNPNSLAEATSKDVDDEISRPGHFQDMAKATPTAGPSRTSGLKAPDVPVNPKIGTKLAAQAKRIYDEDPEAAKANWQAMEEQLDGLAYVINPYVARNRQYMLNACSTFLSLYCPELSEIAHWYTETVIRYAANILVYRITTSRGRDGGPIQSRTAVGWLGHHIYNICTYTRDPESGLRTELAILRRGLYNCLENVVKWCVLEYNLVRHSKIQRRLDRHALQLIFEIMLKSTQHYGRAVAFQTMAAANFALSGALHPGSLQANNAEYVKRELYMKVGDCVISVIRRFCWSVKVTVDNWKGHSGSTGERKVLTFGPVSKAHNLIFEPVLALILHLLARGAFEGIESPDQLFACELAIIPMKPSFLSKPLWLKRSGRGLRLIEGEPVPPHALSSSLVHYGLRVGIEGATLYALRRYAGNIYALSLGRDLTLYLLNHNDRTGKVMDNHYTTGVEDMPLTQILLGELGGKLTETEKLALQNNKRSSLAMNFLICRVKTTNPEIDMYTNDDVIRGRYGLDKEEDEANNPQVIMLDKETRDAWNDIMALVPTNKRAPYSSKSGRKLRSLVKLIPLKDKDRADGRVSLYKSVHSRLNRARQKAVRDLRTEELKSKARTQPETTYKDRDAAEKLLDEDSPWYGEIRQILEKEVKNYLRDKSDPTSMRELSKEDTEAAEEPQEIQEQLAQLQTQENTEKQDDNEDEESDGEDVTEGEPPLAGNGMSQPKESSTNRGKAKISPIHVNLQREFRFDIDTEEEEAAFDDSKEPDSLGVDVDAARAVLIRILWGPHEKQEQKRKTWKPEIGEPAAKGPVGESSISGRKKSTKRKEKRTVNAEGRMACDLCHKFASRRNNIPTFATVSNLERHKREKHDEWSNLELEMETDDPQTFKCPGCSQTFKRLATCKTHCWKHCPNKDEYLHLYEAHQGKRSTHTQDTAGKAHKRKEEGNTLGEPYHAPDYGTQLAEDMHQAFKDHPNALQGWSEREEDPVTNQLRGIPLHTTQQSFGQLAGLAAGLPYQGILGQITGDYTEASRPNSSELQTVIALGSNFMSLRKERMAKAMNVDMERDPTDYEEDEHEHEHEHEHEKDEGEENGSDKEDSS